MATNSQHRRLGRRAFARGQSGPPVDSSPVMATAPGLSGEVSAEMNPGPSQVGDPARAALWNALSTILLRLSNIAIMAVVVRIVTPAEFGTFATAAAVYTVVVSFCELGLSSSLARRDMDADRLAPTVFTISLISAALLAGALALWAPFIAVQLGSPAAATPVRILSICVLMAGLTAVPTGLMFRDLNQRRLFIANALAFVPSSATLLLLARHGGGATAFAWSQVVGQFIVGAYLIGKEHRRYLPRLDADVAKSALAFGLPLAGANLVNYTLLNADYVLVANRLGQVAVGTYVLAFNIASWPTTVIGSALNSTVLPSLSQIRSDAKRLSAAVTKAMRMVCLLSLPISATTIALRHSLVQFLYGPHWRNAEPVLAVLAVYGALFTISLLLANVLSAVGSTLRLLVIQVGWLVMLLACMIVGAHLDGARGVAVAHVTVVALFVLPIYCLALAKDVPGLWLIVLRAIRWPAFAAAVGGCAGWLAQMLVTPMALRVLVGGVVSVGVYLVLTHRALAEVLPARITARIATLFGRASRDVALKPVRVKGAGPDQPRVAEPMTVGAVDRSASTDGGLHG